MQPCSFPRSLTVIAHVTEKERDEQRSPSRTCAFHFCNVVLLVSTRKRGNCECIATWGSARRRSVPTRFNVVARVKFELALPIRCRLRAFLLLIRYVTLWPWTLIPWSWPLTFDLEHLWCAGCAVDKLCTKFELNRAIHGGVIAVWTLTL